MAYDVVVETLVPRTLAAVRRRVAMNDIGREFKPALDKVWAFLRKNPGLRTDGHNVFLYHHENPEVMPVDFGVAVVRTFTGEDEVQCVTTPAGEAAVVVHRGPYEKMPTAHHALHEWCAANRRTVGGYSLEFMATGPKIPRSWRRRSSICCVEGNLLRPRSRSPKR